MREIRSSGKGFFACVCDTLRHIRKCEIDSDPYWINWGKESLFYDATKGENVWEYFYQQPCSPEPSAVDIVVADYTDVPEKGEKFRPLMNRMITDYIRHNAEVTQYLVPFRTGWPRDKKVLGVHIRFTDKYIWRNFGEPDSAKPIDINTYLDVTQRALDTKDLDWIFLASDNVESIDAFNKRFGKRLMFINGPRGTGCTSIHGGLKDVSGFKKGVSVIADVEGLSMCDYLIRSSSNVSKFAQYINLDLEHLNLNEVLQGDKRDRDTGFTSTNYEGLL